MDDDAYPSLYVGADRASLEAQRLALALVGLYSIFMIASAALGALGYVTLAGVSIAFGIVTSLIMMKDDSLAVWYRARAVAESCKTISWRFMMRAKPFDDPDLEAATRLCSERLKQVLQEHKSLSETIGGRVTSGFQVTQKMREVRAGSLDERKSFYLEQRINDQQCWYRKKARHNRTQHYLWFCVIVCLQTGAIVLLILRSKIVDWSYWPIDALVVAAASALTWVQVKRFRELAAAYGLTEQEIGFVRDELARVVDEEKLAGFVDDSENAFSREHTQWLARKNSL